MDKKDVRVIQDGNFINIIFIFFDLANSILIVLKSWFNIFQNMLTSLNNGFQPKWEIYF